VCAYAHAQCCVGTFTTKDGSNPVQPKDETACKAAPTISGMGTWYATCTMGTSCLTMTCTGKQGTTSLKASLPMCTTALLQTGMVEATQTTLTQAGATEVKCAASGAPSSKFASGALLMVSAFVSLAVGSV
jgi:hypothetical protein